jgi:hypothetical protein
MVRMLEEFVPKDTIDQRIQDIFHSADKGRKTDHYLMIWEVYQLKKDHTWDH